MMNRINKVLLLILFITLPCLVLIRHVHAQESSCKCHTAMGKGAPLSIGKDEFVHNPVKEEMCTMCHQAVQDPDKKSKHPGNLTVTLTQQGAELCYNCHEPKNTKKVVHAPIMGGDCTSCHDPHQSPNKGMLKEAMPKLCFQCHDETMMKNNVLHPPVMAGDCSSCHDNHQSDFPNRLVQNPDTLCFMCHPDKEEGLKSKKSVHPPVKESCVLCHSPHGSSEKAMLTSGVPSLCSNCHPNEASLAERAVMKHAPMNDSGSCMNCHDPHFSDFSKLTQQAQFDLCLMCHQTEMGTGKNAIIDMKLLLEKNKNGHGPIQYKDCVSCHNPHGSDYWRILNRYYPSEFYTPYSDGKYGLCFSCHDKAAFAELYTDKATGFRDGRKNLHFVHVNKITKGRTCRACHEVHADSGRPSHVKEFVVFSGWTMPMNFTANKKGGTCAPGCHGEKKYSR